MTHKMMYFWLHPAMHSECDVAPVQRCPSGTHFRSMELRSMTRCCLEARSFTPKSVVPNSKPEYRSVQTNTAAGEREGDSCAMLMPLLPLLFGIAFHLQLVLLSCHPIFLRPYHFLKLVSFLGANRTKSASVCLWLLRGAI